MKLVYISGKGGYVKDFLYRAKAIKKHGELVSVVYGMQMRTEYDFRTKEDMRKRKYLRILTLAKWNFGTR